MIYINMASSHSKIQDKFLIIECLLEMALKQFDTDHENARYGLYRSIYLIKDVKKYVTRKIEEKQDEDGID